MKKIIVIVLSILVTIPLLINLFGANFFLYLQLGKKDLIGGVANGVGHVAWADHNLSSIESGLKKLALQRKTVFGVGPFSVVAEERVDSFQPFYLRTFNHGGLSLYQGFEFPWILLFLIPVIIWFIPKK